VILTKAPLLTTTLHGSCHTHHLFFLMKAHQLFQVISPELKHEIYEQIHTQHKGAYDLVLAGLAQARKFRPVFLLKKPKLDQFKWLSELLKVKTNESIAEQVLQLWLLKGQQKMLGTFLDAVGIPHHEGEVETLPEEITTKQSKAGIAALLKDYSAEKSAVYLTLFQGQRPGGWAALAEAIAAEPALQLKAAA
jgi:hypothetical protein